MSHLFGAFNGLFKPDWTIITAYVKVFLSKHIADIYTVQVLVTIHTHINQMN